MTFVPEKMLTVKNGLKALGKGSSDDQEQVWIYQD